MTATTTETTRIRKGFGRWAAAAAFLLLLTSRGATAPAPGPCPGDVFVIKPGFTGGDISATIRLLPDPKSDFSPLMVISPLWQGRFAEKASIPPGTLYCWARVQLRNESDVEAWSLRVQPSDRLFLFEPRANGEIVKKKTGRNMPTSRRTSPGFTDALEVRCPQNTQTTLFLALDAYNASFSRVPRIRVQLVPAAAVQSEFYRMVTELAAVIGVILIMAGYNLVLFFFVRDRSYLYYSLSIFAVAGYILTNESIVMTLFTPFSGQYGCQLAWASAGLMAFTTFTRHFLEAPQRFPRWNRFLLGLNVGLGLVFLFGAARELKLTYIFLFRADNLYYLIVLISLTAFAVHACRKGFRPARYYLLSSLVFIFFLAVWILSSSVLGLVDFGAFNAISLKLGVVLQVVLFSIALAARVRLLREEVEARQREKEELELRKVEEIRLLIEEKNVELAQKVEERTREVVDQKEEIQRKNLQITASISYARRIQVGVLPPVEEIEPVFAEHFVLFKPKDIVSGDFYWLKRHGERCLVAVADCTGHGVPGALMSMLGLTLLNEIAGEESRLGPGEILDQLGGRVRTVLHQSGRDDATKDGLHIGLLAVEDGSLAFAGAYHPLYWVRDGALTQIKGDRQPVGITRKARAPFTTHRVTVQPGDAVYLASDGFSDQFGGPRGEKFSRRRLRQLLVDLHREPMARQQTLLEEALETWRTDPTFDGEAFEQIDDVLIMGLRIKA